MSIPTTSASVAALGVTLGPSSFSVKPRSISLRASRGVFMARGHLSNVAASRSSLRPIKSRMACTIDTGGNAETFKASSSFMTRRAIVGAGAVAVMQGFMQWGADDQASAGL